MRSEFTTRSQFSTHSVFSAAGSFGLAAICNVKCGDGTSLHSLWGFMCNPTSWAETARVRPLRPRSRGYAGLQCGTFPQFSIVADWASVRNRYEVTGYVRDGPVTRQLS